MCSLPGLPYEFYTAQIPDLHSVVCHSDQTLLLGEHHHMADCSAPAGAVWWGSGFEVNSASAAKGGNKIACFAVPGSRLLGQEHSKEPLKEPGHLMRWLRTQHSTGEGPPCSGCRPGLRRCTHVLACVQGRS